MSLFSELRRRNVFKVGAAYLVLAWLVIQVTDTVAPALGLPDWTLRLVILFGAIGFPFALLFAWAFELTPEGVRRTREVEPGESITRQTGARLNHLIIGLLAAGIVVLLLDRVLNRGTETAEPASESTATTAGFDSIAVLPFANMSEDKANEHFGDGLAEELLNLLAKVDGLKVAARTSSFWFKDKNPTIAEVAEALEVDTVLEGSIRRSGDTIRVVAQLISADDGAHLWSEKYDRPLTDLFAVQDDIANQIVAELMPHLNADSAPVISSDTGKISPDAFERFLLARHTYRNDTVADVTAARDEFLALTKTSPEFAPAWAWLGRSWLRLSWLSYGEVPETVARPAAARAIETAIALDPEEPMAYVARGMLRDDERDYQAALEDFSLAIELDPNLVDAYIERQSSLVYLGRPDAAIDSLEQARKIDPLHPSVLYDLAHLLNLRGQRAEAFDALDRLYTVKPVLARDLESHLYTDGNDYARGVYLLELNGDGDDNDRAVRAFFYQALGLHDEPVIMETPFRAASLAVLGRRDEALSAMEAVMADAKDPHGSDHVQMDVYTALGEYGTLIEVLWPRWLERDSGAPGVELHLDEKLALAAALQHTGAADRAEAILAAAYERIRRQSPLHSGNYLIGQASYATVSGDHPQAVSYLATLAARGNPGMGIYGTPFRYAWFVEGDDRYQDVFEQLTANRAAQVAQLRRMREQAYTPAQVREGYLARHSASATEP